MRPASGAAPGTRTRLKVCCIASADEARLAIAAGADALGLVSAMPSGPGVVAEATITDVVGDAVRAVRPFGVDVCSGLRTGGRLDAAKLGAFAAALASA